MIDRIEILRNYHDQAVIITLSNANKSLTGRIVDDTQEDHCKLVRDPDLVEYYETHNESLLEKVYFKEVQSIEYQ